MTKFFPIVAVAIFTIISHNGIAQSPTLQEYESLLDQAIKRKDFGKASFYTYEIARFYTDEKSPKKAMPYLTQCISYGKKAGDATIVYLGYSRLGMLYYDAKEYGKALDNFEEALERAEALKKNEMILEELIHVATTHEQLGKHKRAIDPLERALSIALRQNDVLQQQQCYELLSAYNAKLGNTAKAQEYKTAYNDIAQRLQEETLKQQEHQALEKQVREKDTEKKTARAQLEKQTQKLRRAEDSLLATRYSLQETENSLLQEKEMNEKRQMQIDLLQKDQDLKELQLKEQAARLENEALIRNSIIVGTALLTVLAGVIFIGYRRKLEANKKIDLQNKSIKSSINYAKRIQEAMLPKAELRQRLLPESFILFKPRDGVSGDFYWFSEIKSWYSPDVVVAAADCTGHGVPGAFMSMIGINSLNGIIGRGIAEPDQILQTLDTEIRTALQQEMTGNNDGMDIALCIYRKEKSILEFAGAKSALVYVQNGKLEQVKGDVHSIGGSKSKKDFTFKKHKVPIEESTMIYLFSDGYRDQFGGSDNMKFMSKKFNQLLLDIHQKPMEEQHDILERTIEAWKSGHPQTDDILVIGFRLEPGIVA
jgi:serine phosphatase RsbU (regulator of sigma subunit)